jgi:hypothetical protein
MEQLPLYVSVTIVLATGVTGLFFYKATHHSKQSVIYIVMWLVAQCLISLTGFYTETYAFPPRFPLLIFPPLVVIVLLFFTKNGRDFIDRLNVEALTLLHVIRMPVELVLYWLFVNKVIPEIMTFEGRNFDILAGLSAPLVYYFGFVKKRLSFKLIFLWNLVCLGSLVNIVTIAILSVPTPFQKLAFDQPNVAVLYFPFVWLPCFIVPAVLLAHLVSMRNIIKNRNGKKIHLSHSRSKMPKK